MISMSVCLRNEVLTTLRVMASVGIAKDMIFDCENHAYPQMLATGRNTIKPSSKQLGEWLMPWRNCNCDCDFDCAAFDL